jgi:hypothetical protein
MRSRRAAIASSITSRLRPGRRGWGASSSASSIPRRARSGSRPAARGTWPRRCARAFDVFASDVHAFGYGKAADFLDDDLDAWGGDAPDWIVTNPPFRTAGMFAPARPGAGALRRRPAAAARLPRGRRALPAAPRRGAADALRRLRRARADDARPLGPEGLLGHRLRLVPVAQGQRRRPPPDRHPARHPRAADQAGGCGRFGFRSEAGLLDAMEGAAE